MLKLRRKALLLGAVLSAVSGCSGDPKGFADYTGEAYPNRRPKLEIADHRLGYLANRGSDTISVVDLDDMKLVGNAPVGRDPVDVDGPRHLVFDRDAGVAYVIYSYPNSNISPHATSLGSNGRLGYVAALSLDDLRPLGELRLDVSPGDIALSSDAGLLAISHSDTLKALGLGPVEERRSTVAFVNPARALVDGTASATSLSVCVVPAAVAFGKDRSRLFVACMGEDTLAVIDTEKAAVLTYVPAGDQVVNQPYALVRDATGEHLLLSNLVAGSVVLFPTSDAPEPISVTHFAESVPYFADFSSDTEYTVALRSPDGVARVEQATGNQLLIKKFDEGECVLPTQPRMLKGRLYLVCQGDGHTPGNVSELDPQTLSILRQVDIGLSPERMEVLEP